jgi:hypothetical protein
MTSLILFTINVIIVIYVFKKFKHTKGGAIAIPVLIGLLVSAVFGFIITYNQAITLKSKIELMQPVAIDEARVVKAKAEFQVINKRIESFIKANKFQVEIADLKGLQIYVAPLSAGGISNFQGLGDIEKGGAEKLKLLKDMIDEQWKIAEKIIELEIAIYKPEFYQLNQELYAIKYGIGFGFLIRLLLPKEPAKVIQNQIIFANGVNLKNN